jgi:hypothetical protein
MSVVAMDRCPWCGNPITHAKFQQIQAAIREDERKKLATAEKALRATLEKEIAAQQQRFAQERKALDAERARLAKQIQAAKQEAEKQKKKEIADIRQILQKDTETKLLKKEAEFARERQALEKRIAEMSRRVKKGGEVGEGAELDLYEELRGAFPDDQITRTKGKNGSTILHEIRYRNRPAGTILLDVTPRAAWQHAFVTRLRQDASAAGVDQAILSTPVFPAGRRELFIDSGIIVVAPARVRAIVEVLRKALIAMHVAKLGDAERSDKMGRLFRFMTSPAFKKKLAEASDLATEALDIDVQEKRAHDLVWRKRGTVLTRIKNVLRDIDTDVAAIIESREEPEPTNPPASLRAAFRIVDK